MIDLVLAGELQLLAIGAVKANAALGQWYPELILLGISKLPDDRDFGRSAQTEILAGKAEPRINALPATTAVDLKKVDRLGFDSTRPKELDLLGLAVAERGATRQGVEMEFIEGFFRHRRRIGHCRHGHHALIRFGGGDFRNISRHQFDRGVLEIPTGAVLHRDPANDIERVTFLGSDEVVARLPGKPAREIAQLGLGFGFGGGLDFPLEARLENRVAAERGKLRLARQAELDFAIDLHDRLGISSRSLVARAQDFRLNDAVGLLLLAHGEIERLPLEKRKQIALGERVVTVVLFQDLERLAGFVAKHHGIRFEQQGGSVVLDFIDALLQIKRH